MKNIFDILAENGIEVSEDAKTAINKSVNENYKTIAEVDKKIGKLETERDGYKNRAETAEETLKGFENVDVEAIKGELETYKQKAANAESEYNKKIYERDFNDALKAEMEKIKFSSDYARKAVETEIREKGLKLDNGKILGFSDAMNALREKDASAFVTENDENKARFTDGHKPSGKQYASKKDIMAIRDPVERQEAIANNISLFE